MSRDATPSLTRHVDALWGEPEDLPGLLEAAEAVEAALGSPGVAILTVLLDAEVATIDRRLDGPALEQAEYARLHGRRGGLSAFKDAARAVVERAASRRQQAESQQVAAGESAAERQD